MKVGLMARCLSRPVTGIGRYTIDLARELASVLRAENLTLFLTKDAPPPQDLPCRTVRCSVPTPHEILRAVWEHTFVPVAARRERIDVYHSPNYTMPLTLGCPSVVTIHDLAFLDRRYHNQRLRWYLILLTSLSLRRASRVIAVSRYTRDAVVQHFPSLRDKVTVVHSGLDRAFENGNTTNGRPRSDRPYILFVGSIEPRKNLPRLIRAFEIAMRETGLPHDLVFCGPWGWRYQDVVKAWEHSPIRERIRHAGYVPSSNLPALYAGADLLAYPSLQEGFGFPVLEAMASGTPVITSNVSALPEIAGDAALMVPPTDVGAIAHAIASVLTDAHLAGDLIERGHRRARPFTWQRAAAETLGVYRQALELGA